MPPEPYRLIAFNTATASENKIHDDTVAQRFGFTGGLVPGVEVAAYATHPVVAHYGDVWFRGGRITIRFIKPVYDGCETEVHATPTASGLDLRVESRGVLCASGSAQAPRQHAEVQPLHGRAADPPTRADRPPADPHSLAVGRRLRSAALRVTPDVATGYLADVRETDPRYAREGVIHPGLLLRRCNAVLVDNVVLPPWVHIASTLTCHAPGRVGSAIHADAVVIANEDRKGHLVADLDCHVRADDGTLLATVLHSAIYRLRA
jgi:acyl dehydratase